MNSGHDDQPPGVVSPRSPRVHQVSPGASCFQRKPTRRGSTQSPGESHRCKKMWRMEPWGNAVNEEQDPQTPDIAIEQTMVGKSPIDWPLSIAL